MTYSIKELPQYTRKEEIINSITHFFGALFAVFTFIFFIAYSSIHCISFVHMIPYYIYSGFMLFMFFMSGFYHSRPFNSKDRAISRIIDHSDIYLFIAGTYTPVSLYAITYKPTGIGLLIGIWVASIIGVIINFIAIDNKVIKAISFALYGLMGWAIAFVYPLNVGISFTVFMLLLFGGISYTLGGVLYFIGKKRKYFHSIFHVFVLIGAVIQFIGVYFVLLA